MKKIFILLAAVTMAVAASAQTRYVYIPGDGEHRFGFTAGTTIASQTMYLGNKTEANAINVDSVLSNIGYNVGIMWGYETDWGKRVESFSFTGLEYNFTPFNIDIACNDGVVRNFSYAGQRVGLWAKTGIVLKASDMLVFNLGVGLDVQFALKGQVKVDGQQITTGRSDDMESFLNLRAPINANVGAKYFITDGLFVGATVQYAFWDFFSLFSDSSYPKNLSGSIRFNQDLTSANVSLTGNVLPLHIMAQVGFAW